MELIASAYVPSETDLQDESYIFRITNNIRFLDLHQDASELYGMLHSRFIFTARGLALMYQKYIGGQFGTCPRVLCEKQLLLPIGMSNEPKTSRVKTYCTKCGEVYAPKDKNLNLDGAYFGTSFPQAFVLAYETMIQHKEPQKYVPKIFGFKLVNKQGSQFKSEADMKKSK